MAVAAVLQALWDFDTTTVIAVVDAAARWLEEPEGAEYAWADTSSPNAGRATSREPAVIRGAVALSR
jgi:hypothetical protein